MNLDMAKEVASCIGGINWREQIVLKGILKKLNEKFPDFEWTEGGESWLEVLVEERE